MDFVNPAILAGAGLAAIPVVLHLIMRQQPRLLEFPALRFLQVRQQANQRRLQLRQLLLLALRGGHLFAVLWRSRGRAFIARALSAMPRRRRPPR